MKNYLVALTLVSTFAIVHTMEFEEDVTPEPKEEPTGNVEIRNLVDCFKEINKKNFELGARDRCYLKSKERNNV